MSKILDKLPKKALMVIESMSREDLINNYRLNLEIDIKTNEKYRQTIFKIFGLSSDKCIKCGECCKTEFVQLGDDEEIQYAKIKGKEFFDMIDENHIVTHLKKPCGFLKNNCCKINDIKPKVCKLYPFSFSLFDARFIQLALCPFGKKLFGELYPLIKNEQNKEIKKLGMSEDRVNELSKEIFGDINQLTENIMLMTGNDGESSSLYKTFLFPREGIDLLYKKLRKNCV